MTIKVYAGISLRRGDGIHFGTLVRLGRGRAGITTDARYRTGDFLEFQLELTGWEQTVTGIAEVAKADIRAPRLNRYLLRILEMRRADRQALQDWYEEQQGAEGSTSDAGPLDSQVGSRVPSRVHGELPRAAGEQAARPPASTWGADRSLSVSQSVEHQGSRRQALRAVLRAAFADPLPGERGVVTPHDHDPEVRAYLELEPPIVELHYQGLDAWRRDWASWLHQGVAFVPYQGPPPALDQEIMVRLVLPGHVDLRCQAQVLVLHPTGFGANLDLDPHQHEGLRTVGDEDDTNPAMAVARALAYTAQKAATTPIDGAFLSRLFGLEPATDPLDAALDELPGPLAAMELANPRDRRTLETILGRADEDYLVLCDEVGQLLRDVQWRWPELEDRSKHARDPMAQAAAWIVLAHVTRLEATQTLRKAAAHAQDEPALVEIGGGDRASCQRCRAQHGRPTTPARLARRGLPPFHLGCQCRVNRVIEARAEF